MFGDVPIKCTGGSSFWADSLWLHRTPIHQPLGAGHPTSVCITRLDEYCGRLKAGLLQHFCKPSFVIGLQPLA